MIQIKNLAFGFKKNAPAQTFSQDLNNGSCTFLVGINGSGKTSLLKTLGGLLPPLQGELSFNGQSLKNLNSQNRPIYLPAHPEITDWVTGEDVFQIFSDTETKWHSEADLQALGIPPIIKKPMQQLSLGEQKRIFLAAALRSPTNTLLLDEPINSLDWNMELVLWRILSRHVQAGRTLIIAAHQLQWISRFTQAQIWFLNQFTRLHAGSLEDILTSTEVQQVFNFRVAFTDNPLDGTRLIATSEHAGTNRGTT